MIARGYIINENGEYEYSDVIDYNALSYVEKQLAKAGTEAWHPLYVSMLNYGAAAQIYFDYNTDNLMNSMLTDAQKALVKYEDGKTKDVDEDNGKFALPVTLNVQAGSSLKLMDNIYINRKFNLSADIVAKAETMKILYWSEAQYNAVDTLTKENATGEKVLAKDGNFYSADISGIAPKDMGDTYYICLYIENKDGTVEYGKIASYSIHKYAVGKAGGTDKLAGLCQAIINYSYEADAMFNK